MPENPLLPNAQLRALHALLSQAFLERKALFRESNRKRRQHGSPSPIGEAVLAGTLLQLCSGDILIPEPGDALALTLTRFHSAPSAGSPPASVLALSPGFPPLKLAEVLSRELKRTGDRLTLVLTQAGLNDPDWRAALAAAAKENLPLVVVCADASGKDTFAALSAPASGPGRLSWSTMQRFASKLHLPVLSVDGEDAVAVYRVTQESILRARAGGGPAVIWAMLPTPAEAVSRPRSSLSLPRLERYLKTRKVELGT